MIRTPVVLGLRDPRARNTGLTGGKAANLARLIADFPVPHGFCVTSRPATPDTPARVRAIERAVRSAYRRLAATEQQQPAVAVRSSALDEDSQNASFAGQHETLLNVAGIDDVLQAVEMCRRSAGSERSRAYRAIRGIEGTGECAVLVQLMIAADVSGVAFSVNPLTGNRDEIVINSNWGLGESVVSGRVIPDTYIVSKLEGTLCREIAEKQEMTVLASQGVMTVAIPGSLKRDASLTDEQARAVARLVTSVEEKMSWPCDIEFAFQGSNLYLLQCRPVTGPRN